MYTGNKDPGERIKTNSMHSISEEWNKLEK